MVKEYYNILELQENCSTSDIKKNYKKMALKWHPDRNIENKDIAEEKFKKISEAYEVLNDDEKRHKYDKFGTLNVSDISHVNPHNIFSQMFGQNPFGQNPLGQNGGNQFMVFNMRSHNVTQQSTSHTVSINQCGKRILRTRITTRHPNGHVQVQVQEQVIG